MLIKVFFRVNFCQVSLFGLFASFYFPQNDPISEKTQQSSLRIMINVTLKMPYNCCSTCKNEFRLIQQVFYTLII